MRLLFVTLSLLCVCNLSACDGTAVILPPQAPQKSASMLQALPNAEYPIAFAGTGKAQLKDGVFEESVAPGSATKTRIWLAKERAFGDANGDGAEDAAVTLVVDSGGSGTFTYLDLPDKGTEKKLHKPDSKRNKRAKDAAKLILEAKGPPEAVLNLKRRLEFESLISELVLIDDSCF
jgi:hypothetical protein